MTMMINSPPPIVVVFPFPLFRCCDGAEGLNRRGRDTYYHYHSLSPSSY